MNLLPRPLRALQETMLRNQPLIFRTKVIPALWYGLVGIATVSLPFVSEESTQLVREFWLSGAEWVSSYSDFLSNSLLVMIMVLLVGLSVGICLWFYSIQKIPIDEQSITGLVVPWLVLLSASILLSVCLGLTQLGILAAAWDRSQFEDSELHEHYLAITRIQKEEKKYPFTSTMCEAKSRLGSEIKIFKAWGESLYRVDVKIESDNDPRTVVIDSCFFGSQTQIREEDPERAADRERQAQAILDLGEDIVMEREMYNKTRTALDRVEETISARAWRGHYPWRDYFFPPEIGYRTFHSMWYGFLLLSVLLCFVFSTSVVLHPQIQAVLRRR